MQSYNVRIKLKFNSGHVTGIIWILTLKIYKHSLHLLNKKYDGFKVIWNNDWKNKIMGFLLKKIPPNSTWYTCMLLILIPVIGP